MVDGLAPGLQRGIEAGDAGEQQAALEFAGHSAGVAPQRTCVLHDPFFGQSLHHPDQRIGGIVQGARGAVGACDGEGMRCLGEPLADGDAVIFGIAVAGVAHRVDPGARADILALCLGKGEHGPDDAAITAADCRHAVNPAAPCQPHQHSFQLVIAMMRGRDQGAMLAIGGLFQQTVARRAGLRLEIAGNRCFGTQGQVRDSDTGADVRDKVGLLRGLGA